MSRIRSLHPEQWSDEQFVSCSPLARLLAIGLRNEADDNGIFEWNLFRLKVRVLPGDNCDMAALLDEITASNQVLRYEIGGKAYGMIRNFQRFQSAKKPTFKHPLPSPETHLPAGYTFHKSGPDRQAGSPPVPHQYGTGSLPDANQSDTSTPAVHPGKGKGKGKGEGEVIPTTSGAAAPPDGVLPTSEPDPIFGGCLSFLIGKGCAAKSARSFLGLMRKEHGDSAIVQAIERAERDDITDPIPWLRKYLEARPKEAAAKAEAWAEGLL